MNNSASKRRLLINAVTNWVGFAAQLVAAFFLAPILVHGLGDNRYGIWSLVESVLAYLMLFDLGVAASVVRYVAKFQATDDRESLNRVFSTSLCIFAVAGLVVLALALGMAWIGVDCLDIPDDLLGEARWLLILLGINLAVGLPLSVFPSVLDGLGRYPVKTAIRTLSLLIRVPLFVMVVRNQGGLVELGWVITGLNLVEHVVMAIVVWRYLPHLRVSWRLADRATFKTIRGYSLDAFLAMVAGRISFQTDAIVISLFLAPEYITFFALGGRLVDYARNSLRAATTVLTPAVSTLEARGDEAAIRGMLLSSTRYVLWLILPVQLGLMLLGKPFLALWMNDDRYAVECFPTLFILSLSLAMGLAMSVPSRILYGMGRLRWFCRVAMLEAAVNLILSLLLVGPLGIEGVAWGTTIPHLLGCMAVGVYTCCLLEVGIGSYLRESFLAPCLAAVPLALFWAAAPSWLEVNTWSGLLLGGGLGIIGFMSLAVAMEIGPRIGWPAFACQAPAISAARRPEMALRTYPVRAAASPQPAGGPARQPSAEARSWLWQPVRCGRP